jgi:putative ABC transport system substrate-binding protein
MLLPTLSVRAQSTPRVAYLSSASLLEPYFNAFLSGLRDLGWIKGQNLTIERRFAQSPEEFTEAARDLVRLGVDVIVTTGSLPTRAAKDATAAAGSLIPVVFASAGDPVGKGFVASLAHPGGNVTGLALLDETFPKLLELARELLPQARTAAYMFETAVVPPLLRASREREYQTAASTFGLAYHEVPIQAQNELSPAFQEAMARSIDVLIVDDTILTKQHSGQIITLAAEYRIPVIYRDRSFVAAGGLVSYGEDIEDLFRRSATNVSRLLKGERPESLPVEQATKFQLTVNMKTATALGLEISPLLLARADEVIE